MFRECVSMGEVTAGDLLSLELLRDAGILAFGGSCNLNSFCEAGGGYVAGVLDSVDRGDAAGARLRA